VQPDLESKLQYITKQPTPRAVFRICTKRDAPASPTHLMRVFDIAENSHYTWYTQGNLPDDRLTLIVAWYGFTPALRLVFETKNHADFVSAYEKHWTAERLKAASAKIQPTVTRQPFVWDPPSAEEHIITRLKALAYEAPDKVGTGHVILAQDARTFVDTAGDTSDSPVPGAPRLNCSRADDQRPQTNDTALVILQLHSTWNENSLPWPLNLDVGLGTSGSGLSIRECSVEFLLEGKSEVGSYAQRNLFPGALRVELSGGRRPKTGLTITPGGDSFKPTYKIALAKGPVGPFTAYDIVKIDNVEPEQTVKVRLIVAIKDFEESVAIVAPHAQAIVKRR
jgi:hypothetical protein